MVQQSGFGGRGPRHRRRVGSFFNEASSPPTSAFGVAGRNSLLGEASVRGNGKHTGQVENEDGFESASVWMW